MRTSLILVLLVAAQACSGARILLGGTTVSATSGASGTESATSSAGATVIGSNVVAGGLATAKGGEVATNVELSASDRYAKSSLETDGEAAGEGGATLTSAGTLALGKDFATSAGFTEGKAKGHDAFVAANTETKSKTRYGEAKATSETFGAGKYVEGAAGASTISSKDLVQSQSAAAIESRFKKGLANSRASLVGGDKHSTTDTNAFTFLADDVLSGGASADGKGAPTDTEASVTLVEKPWRKWGWTP